MTRKEQARSASAEVFPQARAVRKIPLQKTWRKTDLDALNAGPTKGKVSARWTKRLGGENQDDVKRPTRGNPKPTNALPAPATPHPDLRRL